MAGTVNTNVDMANLALAHLKEPRLSAIDLKTKAGRWFTDNYAAYRDAYLAQHDWDFATVFVNLSAEVEKPPFRWLYQYKKPADCLRIPQQTEDGTREGQLIPFEVVGQRIVSNWQAPFPFRYIRRVTTEAEFSPLFVHGFAYFLAAGCCHVITGKNSLKQTLLEGAESAFDTAGVADAMQGTPAPMVPLDIIENR